MNIHHMTQGEIEALIFKGKDVYELTSMRENLTDDQIMSLTDHPSWKLAFSNSFKDWVWSAIDAIMGESGGT